MTDEPQKPKRRRRWLVVGVLILLAATKALQVKEDRRERQRLRLITDLKQAGAFAQIYFNPSKSALATIPILEDFLGANDVLVYIPNAEVGEAVLPLLTDDVTRIEIRGPFRGPLFKSLGAKFRAAAPHAEVLARTRHEPYE